MHVPVKESIFPTNPKNQNENTSPSVKKWCQRKHHEIRNQILYLQTWHNLRNHRRTQTYGLGTRILLPRSPWPKTLHHPYATQKAQLVPKTIPMKNPFKSQPACILYGLILTFLFVGYLLAIALYEPLLGITFGIGIIIFFIICGIAIGESIYKKWNAEGKKDTSREEP